MKIFHKSLILKYPGFNIIPLVLTLSHHFVGIPQESIDRLVGDNDRATLHSDTAARADSQEDRVLAARMEHQLDHLVQENSDGGHSHSMGHREHGPHLVHRVAVGELADVLQLQAGRDLVAYLVHDEVCKALHSLWRATHANELRDDVKDVIRMLSII